MHIFAVHIVHLSMYNLPVVCWGPLIDKYNEMNWIVPAMKIRLMTCLYFNLCLKNYNQWKIQMLYHEQKFFVFLSFQMVTAFLWSWSRCPHDAAGSDRVLCIDCRQVSCRTVTYSELCKNPSIRRRQGQNKTHCWIYQGVLCWIENHYQLLVQLFRKRGFMFNFVNVFSLFGNYFPLGKGRGPSFEQTWIPFTERCFVPSFV